MLELQMERRGCPGAPPGAAAWRVSAMTNACNCVKPAQCASLKPCQWFPSSHWQPREFFEQAVCTFVVTTRGCGCRSMQHLRPSRAPRPHSTPLQPDIPLITGHRSRRLQTRYAARYNSRCRPQSEPSTCAGDDAERQPLPAPRLAEPLAAANPGDLPSEQVAG